MGTPGAVMLFALPPLVVYAIARWYGLSSKPKIAAAPAPRVTALDNAYAALDAKFADTTAPKPKRSHKRKPT